MVNSLKDKAALDELREAIERIHPDIVADYDVVPGPQPEDACHVLHVFNVSAEFASRIRRSTAVDRSNLRRSFGEHVNVVCHNADHTACHYADIVAAIKATRTQAPAD